MKLREIKNLTNRLKMLAVEYQSEPLLKYVMVLESQLQNFDWENLPATLNRFSQIRSSLF